jgi:hypothetical protein
MTTVHDDTLTRVLVADRLADLQRSSTPTRGRRPKRRHRFGRRGRGSPADPAA